MSEQPQLEPDLTANAMRLALNAQLALVGELVAFLVKSDGMTREQAVTMITNLADTIGSSLETTPTSDSQSVLLMPIREHADALRKIAADLTGDAP